MQRGAQTGEAAEGSQTSRYSRSSSALSQVCHASPHVTSSTSHLPSHSALPPFLFLSSLLCEHSQALQAKPRPSTAPVRKPGRGSGDQLTAGKPPPPRDKVVILEFDDGATGGTAGGAVSVTRTQKQKPGVKVKANGPLATGTHSSGAGSEAPVFLASDAKMRELLAARDETIEAQLTLLAERDATIAELNSQIERLSLQVRYYLGLSRGRPRVACTQLT